MPQRRQRPGRSAAERALAERDSLKLNGPSMAWKQRTLKERAIDDAFPDRITASHAPATMPARVSSRKPRPATAGTAERRGTPSGASSLGLLNMSNGVGRKSSSSITFS